MTDIVFVTGSRSEYSLMRRTLIELNKYVEVTIVAVGMHLSPKFGYTVRDIENDGFGVRKVETLLDSDTLSSMAKSTGICLYGITNVIEEESPRLIFVEGDRGDALAGALVGAYLNIPIVHHGGGDISGSVDNKIRYAITMLSDYHLVGNIMSYKRLISMGIPKDRVFNVGEPGIDDIYAKDFTPGEEIVKKFKIDDSKPVILLVYHPNTQEYNEVYSQICEILEAIKELKYQTIAIYSNADAGGRIINKVLDEYSKKLPFLKVYPHLPRRDFLGLMNVCDVMIGNTSAGIVELPSFKKPFVCIGSRQKNRLDAGNVIRINPNKNEIISAINKTLFDEKFKKKLKMIRNPYGDGKCYLKICKIILNILNKGGK